MKVQAKEISIKIIEWVNIQRGRDDMRQIKTPNYVIVKFATVKDSVDKRFHNDPHRSDLKHEQLSLFCSSFH